MSTNVPKDRLYAVFLERPSGGEAGLLAVHRNGTWMPVVSAEEARVDQLMNEARECAKKEGAVLLRRTYLLTAQHVVDLEVH